YARGDSAATQHVVMRFDADTGVWSYHAPQHVHSLYYTYLVEVYVPGLGVVRNRVADPYSLSATTDSQRSYLADLDSPALMPRGWRTDRAPRTVQASPDMSIYELHVRDFSIADRSVRPAWRGKYLAFTEPHSAGMRHLRALAHAGITDVHLLPVFDFGSVPEAGCVTPHPQGSGDSEAPQAVVGATRDIDCYNWGYDPVLYSAPEGSYASDAADGARRVVELRAMVQALHRAGLRVGMDVVYNHTYAAGQAAMSVLDRIVPGYYHRLSESGAVEQSTCCANTATEHRMMARLMIDSVLGWATHYHIDSFRFDLMGHQPRAVMQRLQQRLRAATGHDVPLIGEGWNFGEVADGRRFVQASQLSLGDTGIGTFSDRARDALRGGGPGDQGLALRTQGYINGRVTDPNRSADPRLTEHDLACTADLVRVGLAGTLAGYRMRSCDGSERTLHELPYNGQPAGYASAPGEVVNYVENHDNHTLFDANVLKLPRATSHVDRVRVQMLGAALVALSQGVAYFHAGIDTLRSKSLDRNSFNSGDWFNRIDWSYRDNNFARGAPPAWDNAADYSVDKPLLRDPGIAPRPRDIALARDMFADLLRIRRSSTLFHLRSAQDVQQRLRFDNIGAQQNARVVVGHLRGAGYPGARFRELLYLVNVDKAPQTLTLPQERGKRYVLHPVQASPRAADARPRQAARYDPQHGRFTLPARSTVVYVVY
ncbi:MAG: DUF3372 domain-containing protein, partial [Betaproteobacteria bacterium]|nr:DUF3372 domain-containing protein [Betaproteobacteria bacterium]